MSGAMIQEIIAFVIYLGLMIYVGFSFIGKNKSTEDFFLGGRNIGPWTTALSAEASDMSGWMLMGLPGLAYLGGMKEAFWTALGLLIGTYLNWLIVAKRLRTYSIVCNNSITIPQFFTNRFKDTKHIISIVSAVFIILFFVIYTASGFVACAKLLEAVFGLPYICGLFIAMVIILVYTLLGGFGAVCTTDFIQGTLMFLAIIITGIIVSVKLGGPVEAINKANEFTRQALNGELGEKIRESLLNNQKYGTMSIVSALAWGLGYFGMPHIIVRFMGIRSNNEIKIARRVAMIWVTIALLAAVYVGAIGTSYLLPKILEGGKSETVIIESFMKAFPPFIAGIFLCSILAAAMSTADSQLLVAASAFTEDIWQNLSKRKLSQKFVMNLSRIAVLLVALIAFFIALDNNASVMGLVSYAWAGFGATFGPLILLALFWKKTTSGGAIAGIIAGAISVILWHNLQGGIWNLYEIIPGFVFCLLFAIIVSLIQGQKNPDIDSEWEEYKLALKTDE